MKKGELPFALERASGKPLSAQLAEGIRTAIFEGKWSAGDVLPTREQLSKALGVSGNTVRAAIAALTAEGLVRTRPHNGCEVLRHKTRRLSGRVLHVIAAQEGPYPISILEMTLRNRLNDAGLRYSLVSVPHDGDRLELGRLRNELLTPPDICVVEAWGRDAQRISKLLERIGVPYLFNFVNPCKKSFGPHCLGSLACDFAPAIRAFADDCRAAGVKSVCRFAFGTAWDLDPDRTLEAAGIAVECVNATDRAAFRCLGDYMDAGRRVIERRLKRGDLGELLFFTDDYMTLGALTALLEHGVRIPKDVCVVSHANKGFCPPFSKSLARIEYDPEAAAGRIAESVIAWFRTGTLPPLEALDWSYIPGETFPRINY